MTQQALPSLSPWEVDMNPEQLAVIRHVTGPIRVLAQAGSGKTRALVHRIARLVEVEHVDPDLILAVTFSKKAADEMNVRLKKLGIAGARVGTWHSLCLEILKTDETEWATWEVDEKDRAKYFVKEAIGYKFLDWKNADLGQVCRFIGRCKANLFAPRDQGALDLAQKEGGWNGEKLIKAYEISQSLIEERGLLTFDDFLVFVHRHLTRNEQARRKWAGRWTFMLQDEAQDANLAQVEIAKLLASGHRNYMVVGDVAQAIYGFRGSTPVYLHEFDKDWPDAVTVTMNRNYRSGDEIVKVANNIIRPASIRLPEDMIAERRVPGEVRIVESTDYDAEADTLVKIVQDHTRTGEGDFDDVTALFRTNAQSRALEEALLKARIPYVVVGGSSFYERREVKDLLAYLRVAAECDDEGDGVKRCINSPFRFLGMKFVDKLMDMAKDRNNDWPSLVLETAKGAGIQGRQRESARDWAELIVRLTNIIRAKGPEAQPGKLLSFIVQRTNYLEWLKKEEGEESIESSHVANVHELIRVAERFTTVETLLEYIAENLAASKKQRKDKQAGGDRVLLMSIHRSKGLEWPIVFVAGMEEGSLPHYKGDPEEERRLAYVAATRARDTLILSYVRNKATKEGISEATPSHFLSDAGLLAFDPQGEDSGMPIDPETVDGGLAEE